MNYDYYRHQAIIGAQPLIAQYGIDRCIHTCRRFCDVPDKDDDFKDMRLLYLESKNDPCLDKIREEATVKYGARNLLSAFYYWARAMCCSQTSGFRVTFLLPTGFLIKLMN